MKNKKRFRIWKVVRKILLAIAALLVFWLIFNNIMTAYEQKKYPAIGKIVEVDGKRMHVYSKGEGDDTILLLSGFGTPAPALDFEPLINELSKNNKVVVVEPFGYGWSDITDKKRTVENIVEETRTALKKSKIKGPYILMPHSISGIYSLYYANRHPEEVKAIIGIDSTLPQTFDYYGESAPALPKYMSYAALTGIARLETYLSPEDVLPLTEKGTYTAENQKMTKAVTAWKYSNKAVVNEASEINHNIDKTINMTFPTDLPVMIFTTEEKVNGKSRLSAFKKYQKIMNINKIVILEGNHYLHWTQYKEMSKNVNEFTEKFM